MARTSRADKKLAREQLLCIESNPKATLEEIEQLGKYFSFLGIPQESEYFERIEKLKNGLQTKLEEPEKIQKAQEKIPFARYSGIYRTSENRICPIKINFRYDHLFLSRHYRINPTNSSGIKVSWRFEKEGELYLIDALDTQTRKITHVLGPMKKALGNYSWSRNLDGLFVNFPDQDERGKVDLLLRWGYTSVKELAKSISENRIKDSDSIRESEKGLTEIVKNIVATNILENASKRNPYLSGGYGHGEIIYS